MAKTSQIDLLRKLIREEVAKAIRQEMPAILQEVRTSSITKEVIKESKPVKKAVPLTLNTHQMRPAANFSGNPLANILNETAMSMVEMDDMSFTSGNIGPDSIGVDPTSFFQPKQVVVGDVNSMLSTARASSDPSMVQINEVPDFTQLMSKLKAKGAI